MIAVLQEEVWQPVPGTDGMYEASSLGRVRTFYKNPQGRSEPLPRILNSYPRSQMRGRLYHCVVSKLIGRVPVHRLVASAFYGEIPHGFEVDHIDGDPHNNNADNLRIVTRRQNHLNRRARTNTGTKHVHRRNDNGLYQVYVDRKYVGTFPTQEEAERAAADARAKVGYPVGVTQECAMRVPKGTFVFLALMTAVAAFADPTVRPVSKAPHNEQYDPTYGRRAPSPWTPTGKSGYWVFVPNPLGLGLPFVRNFIEHPIELPAPGQPDDVEGPG